MTRFTQTTYVLSVGCGFDYREIASFASLEEGLARLAERNDVISHFDNEWIGHQRALSPDRANDERLEKRVTYWTT